MKSMDDYIKGVHEKYMETKKNNIVYEKVSMKYPKYSPLTKICGVAACLALICVGVIGVNNFDKMKTNEDLQYATSENIQGDETVYTNVLISDDKCDKKYLEDLISYSNAIAIVSNVQVKKTVHDFRIGRFVISSVCLSNIEKILSDKKEIIDKELYFSKSGGKISLAELQKDDTVDWTEWEKMYIGHEIEDAKKATTYFHQVPSKGCELEEGKQYLVFMSYNEAEKIYEVFDIAYGIMEYDPITNMVKNIDTGEFEEFDWDLITEKSNK